jgi:CRP-like cAMP-binding protein
MSNPFHCHTHEDLGDLEILCGRIKQLGQGDEQSFDQAQKLESSSCNLKLRIQATQSKSFLSSRSQGIGNRRPRSLPSPDTAGSKLAQPQLAVNHSSKTKEDHSSLTRRFNPTSHHPFGSDSIKSLLKSKHPHLVRIPSKDTMLDIKDKIELHGRLGMKRTDDSAQVPLFPCLQVYGHGSKQRSIKSDHRFSSNSKLKSNLFEFVDGRSARIEASDVGLISDASRSFWQRISMCVDRVGLAEFCFAAESKSFDVKSSLIQSSVTFPERFYFPPSEIADFCSARFILPVSSSSILPRWITIASSKSNARSDSDLLFLASLCSPLVACLELSPLSLIELSRFGTVETFQKSKVMFKEGEHSEKMYLCIHGAVRIFNIRNVDSESGSELNENESGSVVTPSFPTHQLLYRDVVEPFLQISRVTGSKGSEKVPLCICSEGSFIGDRCIFGGVRATSSVEVLTESATFISWSRSDIHSVLRFEQFRLLSEQLMFLLSIPLFQDLLPSRILKLLVNCETTTFESGQSFFDSQHAPSDEVLILMRGEAVCKVNLASPFFPLFFPFFSGHVSILKFHFQVVLDLNGSSISLEVGSIRSGHISGDNYVLKPSFPRHSVISAQTKVN